MSAPFETDFYQHLTGLAAVRELAAGAVYPVRAPDRVPSPVWLVYAKVSGPRDPVHDGNPGFAHPRYQLSCWSADYAAAKRLALALVQALHGYRGPMGATDGVAALVDNEADLWDAESRLHHVVVDVVIWHTEAVAAPNP